MKTLKKTLLIFFGMAALGCYAQSQAYLVDTTSIWHVADTYLNSNPQNPSFSETKSFTYGFRGDTLITNRTWHKIYRSRDSTFNQALHFMGLLREEGKKVYFIDTNQVLDTLYDFSLTTGDTVKFAIKSSPIPFIVGAVDSLLIAGKFRRRIHFNEPSNSHSILPFYLNEVWIEGIGSVHYPLNPFSVRLDDFIFNDSTYVTCYRRNDTVIWRNPFYPKCIVNNILSLPEEHFNRPELRIFPNPARDFITVDFASSTPVEKVRIYDLMGKVMLTVNQGFPELPLNSLPPGSYILAAFGEGAVIHAPLVIK